MEEVEVDIASTGGKAVIEGKTAVPFKTFVSLILQRKVQSLFKTSQEEPVIVGAELLTKLASAPEDKQEDRSKLIMVTFFTGLIGGIFISAAILLGLALFDYRPDNKDLLIVLGAIGVVFIIVLAMQKTKKKSPFAEKLQESMEKMTDMISR